MPMASSDIAEIMGALGRLTAQVEQLREDGRALRSETASLRACVTRLDAAITAMQDDEQETAASASVPQRLVSILEKNIWLLPVMLLLGALLFGGGALVDLITRGKP